MGWVMNVQEVLHVGKCYDSGLNHGKYGMVQHNLSLWIQHYGLASKKLTHSLRLWQIDAAWLCVPIAHEAGFGLWAGE